MHEQIERLKANVHRRAALKAEFEQLEAEHEALDKELFALKIDAHNQQADVDLLNCFSFKNLYYDLTGKKEAMLAKETSEARAAKGKLNAAEFRLAQVSSQLESCAREIHTLQGCEAEYWELLYQTAATDPLAEKALQERKAEVASLLQIATEAGNTALEQIYDTLKNIENVMEWNMALAGTGWTMAMPGYLNGTQSKIEILRKMLCHFCRKLDAIPLPSDAILAPEDILNFPKNYLHELTGRFGADERLHDADAALHAAKDRIFEIQEKINEAQNNLNNV